MSEKTVYVMDPRVALEEEEDGRSGVLFDTYTATICTCNDTAWAVLGALEKGSSLEELSTLLAERFDVEAEVAKKDTIVLLKELSAMELLHEQG